MDASPTLTEARERAETARALAEAAKYEAEAAALRESYGLGFGDAAPLELLLRDRFGGGPDGQLWLPLGGISRSRNRGDNSPLVQSEEQLDAARDASRVLADTNPTALGIRSKIVSFVIGTGYTYRATSDDATLARRVQDVLDDFLARNEWTAAADTARTAAEDEAGSAVAETRECELVDAAVVDGEFLVRTFGRDDGSMDVRSIPPEHVRQPPGSTLDEWSYGLRVPLDPPDVERCLEYAILDPLTQQYEGVSPAEIVHYKRNVRRGVKRGLPDFWATRTGLEALRKILRNVGVAAGVQSAIPWIEQYAQAPGSGVAGAVQAARDRIPAPWNDPVTGKQVNAEHFAAGTIPRVGKGKEYVPAPQAQGAPNHIAIVQAVMREVGNRWDFPEYMVSGDASNANYASTLVAGAPLVRRIRREQGTFSAAFLRVVWRAVWWACQCGRLPPFDLVRARVTIQCEQPPPEIVNEEQQNQVWKTQHDAGILSAQTWRQKAGLDNDQERKNLEEEPPQPPGGNPFGGGGGADPFGGPPRPGGGLGESLAERVALLRERYGAGTVREVTTRARELLEGLEGAADDGEADPDAGDEAERLDVLADILGGLFGEDALKWLRSAPAQEALTAAGAEGLLLEAAAHKEGDVWRGPSGRWFTIKKGRAVPAAAPAEHVQATHDKIAAVRAGARTPAALHELTGHLAGLTVPQLRELKAKHQLPVPSRALKAALVEALAAHLHAGMKPKARKQAAPAAAPPAQPAAKPKKAKPAPTPPPRERIELTDPGDTPAPAPTPAAGGVSQDTLDAIGRAARDMSGRDSAEDLRGVAGVIAGREIPPEEFAAALRQLRAEGVYLPAAAAPARPAAKPKPAEPAAPPAPPPQPPPAPAPAPAAADPFAANPNHPHTARAVSLTAAAEAASRAAAAAGTPEAHRAAQKAHERAADRHYLAGEAAGDIATRAGMRADDPAAQAVAGRLYPLMRAHDEAAAHHREQAAAHDAARRAPPKPLAPAPQAPAAAAAPKPAPAVDPRAAVLDAALAAADAHPHGNADLAAVKRGAEQALGRPLTMPEFHAAVNELHREKLLRRNAAGNMADLSDEQKAHAIRGEKEVFASVSRGSAAPRK